jgi:membrane protein YqaA with SNARE-associated domain
MHRLVERVQTFALALGGPGLFLIAFLDSSFLSFPEVVDLVIVIAVTAEKQRIIYYPLLATLGSVAGCLALYLVGVKGGEALLRKRLHERHVDRALAVFQRHGLLTIIVPSLLPPPFPFKPFVLAAGVAGIRPADFLMAVTLGRGMRYFGEGLLAFFYGERAARFIRENAGLASLVIAALILAGGLAWIWYQKKRPV